MPNSPKHIEGVYFSVSENNMNILKTFPSKNMQMKKTWGRQNPFLGTRGSKNAIFHWKSHGYSLQFIDPAYEGNSTNIWNTLIWFANISKCATPRTTAYYTYGRTRWLQFQFRHFRMFPTLNLLKVYRDYQITSFVPVWY